MLVSSVEYCDYLPLSGLSNYLQSIAALQNACENKPRMVHSVDAALLLPNGERPLARAPGVHRLLHSASAKKSR